ncbi:NADP-dependent oxidoreductase [Paraburkholderia bannensis]|uniref:NADP-dependent oxidoreductase n=1 Tax=Paraburkholderia bannensis TaxID=765414 RepID=UPI002AB6D2DD|nr:NADP-dependent oxidoreductase [Paraburkholderia bannensis]
MTVPLNQQWLLRRRPAASVSAADLELVDTPLPPLADDQILVRTLYLSIDPTNRLWMSERDQYLPPVGLGDVMRGTVIGVVESSRSARFAAGDLVMPPVGGWQRYSVEHAASCRRLTPARGLPLTAYLSVLGLTGLTAYAGMLDIGQPRPGETVVISAAAGAVGSVAGQIAKIHGCRVIGIAGGAGKCAWLVDQLGFDGAIDYKHVDVGAALDRLCPDGVDVSFENVGGAIMDAVFQRLNRGGRMAVCGLISGYNDEAPLPGPTDFGRVLMNRLTIRGFVVIDHLARAKDAMRDLAGWIEAGRLQWKDHVIDGLHAAPDALQRLFTGRHDGKLIVRVSTLD